MIKKKFKIYKIGDKYIRYIRVKVSWVFRQSKEEIFIGYQYLDENEYQYLDENTVKSKSS